MAGRPRTRAKRQAQQQNGGRPTNRVGQPKFKYLADIYAERYTTFDALRTALVQNGIVEHRINPYDVIQRAIDDTTTDYLLLRRKIDKDTHGDPEKIVNHPLYTYMEEMREAAVRYSTFATQYDIQRRQLKLSESRVALLSHTLRGVLQELGLSHDQIRQVPKLLIEAIKAEEPKTNSATKLDSDKATAIAEILHHDAEITIEDVEEIE